MRAESDTSDEQGVDLLGHLVPCQAGFGEFEEALQLLGPGGGWRRRCKFGPGAVIRHAFDGRGEINGQDGSFADHDDSAAHLVFVGG
jgi:hypothetical protein